jgi:hypothetical protein
MESGDGDASFFDLMSTRTKVVLIGVGVLGAVLALKPLVWLEAWPVLLLGAAAFLIAERREKAAQQAMVAQARARMAERAGRRGRGVCGGAAGAAGGVGVGGVGSGGAGDGVGGRGGVGRGSSGASDAAAEAADGADAGAPASSSETAWPFAVPQSSLDIVEAASASGELERARSLFAQRGTRASGRRNTGHAGLGGSHAGESEAAPEKRLYQGRTKRGKPVKTIKSRGKAEVPSTGRASDDAPAAKSKDD